MSDPVAEFEGKLRMYHERRAASTVRDNALWDKLDAELGHAAVCLGPAILARLRAAEAAVAWIADRLGVELEEPRP